MSVRAIIMNIRNIGMHDELALLHTTALNKHVVAFSLLPDVIEINQVVNGTLGQLKHACLQNVCILHQTLAVM